MAKRYVTFRWVRNRQIGIVGLEDILADMAGGVCRQV